MKENGSELTAATLRKARSINCKGCHSCVTQDRSADSLLPCSLSSCWTGCLVRALFPAFPMTFFSHGSQLGRLETSFGGPWIPYALHSHLGRLCMPVVFALGTVYFEVSWELHTKLPHIPGAVTLLRALICRDLWSWNWVFLCYHWAFSHLLFKEQKWLLSLHGPAVASVSDLEAHWCAQKHVSFLPPPNYIICSNKTHSVSQQIFSLRGH